MTGTIALVSKPIAAPPEPFPAGADDEVKRVHARRRLAWTDHHASLAAVDEALVRRGLRVLRMQPPELDGLGAADVVVTVGGDGTFLAAARAARSQPILGVNSSPKTSTGHYCGATLATLDEALDGVFGGGWAPAALPRIRALVDGEDVGVYALNDVLFANRSPAGSTRYVIDVDGASALQLSSGVWVCTASGYTGAMRSAGGEPMAADDGRLQYLVREPYCVDHDGSHVRGFVSEIAFVSRSDANALFLDGQMEAHPVGFGARATLSADAPPLLAFGYRPRG
ncbi:MAG: NAD(+)/NADH kinase [Myxococcales bacterium]|nr:NAD(+)/NADH kinase [Myxococcales bacterium]MCB9733321.1 NAD(+)/NADH kinase [Deltaproteobacteria bacterium]